MKTICLMLLAGVLLGSSASWAEKMNILFIAIDDMTTTAGYMRGQKGNFLKTIYPDDAVWETIRPNLTPNIDALAASGVSFMNAHCSGPVCNPSRTALLTGMPAHATGILGNPDGYFRDNSGTATWNGQTITIKNAITLPQNLRTNGYYTAGTGKIFHGEDDVANSWNYYGGPSGSQGVTTNSPWMPSGVAVKFGSGTNHYTQWNDYVKSDFIADLMQYGSANGVTLPNDKPFFLACGIFRPHLPWECPVGLLNLFDRDDIQLTRATLNGIIADLDDIDKEPSGGRFEDWISQFSSANDDDITSWREGVRHYLASCALADRCVQRLMDGLANSPYADNTIVVLWSDHGYHLGEKYHVTKMTVWEESANVLYIIKDPRQPENAGMTCHTAVSLMDLYRTICAYAEVSVPQYVAGWDLTGLVSNPSLPWKGAALTSYGTSRAVRTEEYRFIRRDGTDELYDMLADADQITNLIHNPAYTTVKNEMNALLDTVLAGDLPQPSISDDTTPPTPDPAEFESVPTALSQTEITMTAVEGADADNPPVSYYFAETSGNSGGDSSGWQSSRMYVDDGLVPGMQYAYTITMKDSVGNQTTSSSPQSVFTYPKPDIVLDGIIDRLDLMEIVQHWLDYDCFASDPALCGFTDLNASGQVDFDDVAILASVWLDEEPLPTLLVYEPFEGTAGGQVPGADTQSLNLGSWSTPPADQGPTNFKFAGVPAYTDGNGQTLLTSGSGGFMGSNCGPSTAALDVPLTFAQGDSVYISFIGAFLRKDYQQSWLRFVFNGGDCEVRWHKGLVDNDASYDLLLEGTGVSTGDNNTLGNYDFYVIRVDFSAGAETIRLWRNPLLNTKPADGEALLTGTIELGGILNSVEANSDAANSDFAFDEIRVGRAYADVTPIE